MYPFTRKYQAGGALDTNAMRDDLSKDGDFFRDGNYTQKGRRRLAAIQKVEDNQDNGLSYNIDDKSGTFEVVDALGRLDVNSGGHGIGSSERSGLLYGTFNKDRRSKREISSLMSGASKYIIKNVEEEADTELDIDPKVDNNTTADTTIADNTIYSDPSPKPIEGLTKDQEEAKALGLDFTKGATAKILSAQKRLKAAGFDPGPLDGKWGVNTQAAWNKAYPKETTGKTGEEIEVAAKAVIGVKEEAAEAEAVAKAKAAKDVADNEAPVVEKAVEEILNPNIASNNTISAENLDKIADSPIDKLDRIAEADDIQAEINLREVNGGVPSEDPRFKDRSVAELEMDKYDLVERGSISTTTDPGGDLFDVNLKTNTSTQGGTLFSGIGEGDVKTFLDKDNTANQLFSSKSNKGIIDNSEKIKLYRDEIKSRQDSDYNKAGSPFSGETVEELNQRIKGLNKDSLDSINNQVISSYDNTSNYLKKELKEQIKIVENLRGTNASAEDIKNAKITRDALRSRIAHLVKKKEVFNESGITKKSYKDFYGDVVLSDDNSKVWDKTRGRVADAKTRIAEVKEVKRGKDKLSNVLKNPRWLKPEDLTKFKELVGNNMLNKGDDGKGFDADKMVDKVTEEYIQDVAFFQKKGTYEDDNGKYKSFKNYSKDLGIKEKDIYKNLPHLKASYSRYIDSTFKNDTELDSNKEEINITPRTHYEKSTIRKIGNGESVEKYLTSEDKGNIVGTVRLSRVAGGIDGLMEYIKDIKVDTKTLRDNPQKALWIYNETMGETITGGYGIKRFNELSVKWDQDYGNRMAKYKKGGVLKFAGGNLFNTEKTINKPKFSFLPNLNLGKDNNLVSDEISDFEMMDRLKKEQIDNTKTLTSLPSRRNRTEVITPTNVAGDVFNKQTRGNSGLTDKQQQTAVAKDAAMDAHDDAIVTQSKGYLEKIRDKYKNSYTDSGDVNNGDGTEGNAPLFSRTGINTPLGEVQYNDIAQYYLAKRARDRKVGDVKLNLKKHIDQGYNNVLAARDIDTAMLNQADQEIAKISSGYKGSDPMMAMVANKMAGEAKNKAKMGVISERADFRGKEEKRVFDAMNVVRKQKSDDNVRANDTRFANNQLKFNAELAAVKEKAAREYKFDNVKGKLLTNIQGRANTNAALEKGLITEAEVIDRQKRAALNESRYKDANIAYNNAIDKPKDQQDADEIANLLKLKNSADDARNVDKYDRNKATADYNRINKGTSKLQLGTSIFKNLFG